VDERIRKMRKNLKSSKDLRRFHVNHYGIHKTATEKAWSFKRLVVLDESDVRSSLSEALSADIQVVLSDEGTLVG
jgi:hypothetical protein